MVTPLVGQDHLLYYPMHSLLVIDAQSTSLGPTPGVEVSPHHQVPLDQLGPCVQVE